jgi:hypothetical protein
MRVILAKAEDPAIWESSKALDPGFRRDDGFGNNEFQAVSTSQLSYCAAFHALQPMRKQKARLAP